MSEELREIKWISYGDKPLINLSKCDSIAKSVPDFSLVFYGNHNITWEFKTSEEMNMVYNKIKNAMCFKLELL